ncbi:MAG: Holliday junction resolvase RuvX [Gammaproteobacteria bacterium]|nr:Holliday junction resolvase RuvX [Gammaproteobacteria bacterium]
MNTRITSVIGFDYGLKRIGIATGQTITNSATPITTLNQINGSPDWPALEQLINQWKPQALIVGMPYYLDGKENDMTKSVEAFCLELEQRFTLPVFKINEALSSYEAETMLKKNTKIGKHNKHEIDKMAAAIIVQNWLNQQ